MAAPTTFFAQEWPEVEYPKIENKTSSSHPFLTALFLASCTVIVGTGAWLWMERTAVSEDDKVNLINKKRGLFIGNRSHPYLELVENTLK